MDIRDESPSPDELRLSLYDGNERAATASASRKVLEQMAASLGLSREDVRIELESSLRDYETQGLAKARITNVLETPGKSGHYVAEYLHADFAEITAGMVFYDMPSGTTGPDGVPTLVRNKLRYVVHDMLVKGNPAADALRDALR